MKEIVKTTCEAMIYNKDKLKEVLKWEDNRILTVCASLYVHADKSVNVSRVENCKKQIKSMASVFSEIRGMALSVITCMIDIRGGEPEQFDQLMTAYKTLRKEFHPSPLLAIGAEILAERYEPDQYLAVTEKAKTLYKIMQKNHPFVTGADDYLMCILLAQAEKNETTIGSEVETCFAEVKKLGLKGGSNALQSVSCALSLYEESVESKSQKLVSLYDEIRKHHMKYDKTYGLPMLVVLSQLDVSREELCSDLSDVNEWLKNKKEFRMLMGESIRMMYAALLVSQSYSRDQNASTSVAGSVIAAMIAEQVAMVACIAAASSASASSEAN
ncbi:MAG: DUF4003 domain-containing protein [Lachnospiraceae bacterium]|nr:DUF4003 domain-containing protein [Lachnospiraceae bacterium]